jgi:hypothetical protein
MTGLLRRDMASPSVAYTHRTLAACPLSLPRGGLYRIGIWEAIGRGTRPDDLPPQPLEPAAGPSACGAMAFTPERVPRASGLSEKHSFLTSAIERHSFMSREAINSNIVPPGRSESGPAIKNLSASSRSFGLLRGQSQT